MELNSWSFAVFFALFFLIYHSVPRNKTAWQNLLLLFASLLFYALIDLRMLWLIVASTLLFYFIGRKIDNSISSGKLRTASCLTSFGVCLGIGMLFIFKYFDFFIAQVLSLFNQNIESNIWWRSGLLIMPVGLSFYTFKLISYVIEIHRRHISSHNSMVAFSTYITFFPTILSGPIDRPQFISQLSSYRNFNYPLVVEGCRQILWGLFKKMVIADNLANITTAAWANHESLPSIQLIICMFIYTFQMYADFSGYSDIAIGLGKLLGLKIHRNFDYPLYAQNIAQYWRKWHMSLTSWLTDYVFMPLNIRLREYGNLGLIVAIMIDIFLVGIWHGANWTYAIFGIYHGLLFVPLILHGSFHKKLKLKTSNYLGLPTIQCIYRIIGTFSLVTIGLLIFSAPSISALVSYINHIIRNIFLFPTKQSILTNAVNFWSIWSIFLAGGMYILEWYTRDKEFVLAATKTGIWAKRNVRIITYYALIMVIYFYGAESSIFIYSQF